ncbi:MAG: tripartite tricarboxylate transporter permease [Methanomassiliicoccales archaeon]|nr:MAG: tripartite tricarboxylate transporter permease [Methanomassiliicoccales archaeon]
MIINLALVGAALGAFTGVAPGIHVNTLAQLVLLLSPVLLGCISVALAAVGLDASIAPMLLACMLVSAAIVHSFLDFIPSALFGAPEEQESLSALPAHKLLLSGRSMEAITCAASGSLTGALVAILISVPLVLTFSTFPYLAGRIDPFIPGLLLCTAVLLIVTQPKGDGAEWSILVHRCDDATIDIRRPIPVDGQQVTVTGHVVRDGPFSKRILVKGNSWRLQGRTKVEGMVTVHGVWKVRRRRWVPMAHAFFCFMLSGAIGVVAMDGRPPGSDLFAGLDGNLLFPMLTGLFAMPALIVSSSASKVPLQDLDSFQMADRRSSFKGVWAGLFSAWVPGVTATAGTVLGELLGNGRMVQEDADIRFISMTASIGTAATVFGIVAMTATGSGGTGVLIAVGEIAPMGRPSSLDMPTALLLAALVASLVGYELTIFSGRRLAARISGTDASRSSKAIILFELILIGAFTGLPGLIMLAASTLVGMVPPAVGVSRVSMTGCLILPLLLSYFHLSHQVLYLLGGL